VAALHSEATTLETWLRLVLARTPLDGPLVLLSTVHRIKGREWGHVVIFGASRGLFPHRLGNDEEDERRVFHVALTRARTQVVTLADAESPSIFLAELDGSRIRASSRPVTNRGNANLDAEKSHRSSNGTDTGRLAQGPQGGRGSGRRRAGAPRQVGLPAVEAILGLVVEDRGSIGTIVQITTAVAVLSIGAVTIEVAFGSDVRVNGKSVTLVAPAVGPTGGRAGTTNVEEALRTWRLAVARKEAVPAYVILKDTDLAAIAERDPRTLADLANCRGIGQIRLERWGDEILGVLDAARSG
jgi:superfamily II DNA helicase RecQ